MRLSDQQELAVLGQEVVIQSLGGRLQRLPENYKIPSVNIATIREHRWLGDYEAGIPELGRIKSQD